MRINNALRKPGRARGKAHRRSVVFANRGVAKIVARTGEQFFVIQKTFRQGTAIATVGNNDDALEGRAVTEFLKRRQQAIVDEKEAVASMFDDAGNFMRVKTEVQRVQNAARAGNSKERLQVARMIPHHRSHAIAGLESEFQ